LHIDLPPSDKKGREILLSRPVFPDNVLFLRLFWVYCGSFPAGKGRPALPDQPEEEEEPLTMPNRTRLSIKANLSLKKDVWFIP